MKDYLLEELERTTERLREADRWHDNMTRGRKRWLDNMIGLSDEDIERQVRLSTKEVVAAEKDYDEFIHLLHKCVDDLQGDPTAQKVFEAKYIKELGWREILDETGIGNSTYFKALERALRQVHNRIALYAIFKADET